MTTAQTDLRKAIALIEGAIHEIRTDDAPWYHTAMGEVGVREAKGDANDPRVLEYLATCSRDQGGTLGEWGASRDSTPWCSAFVNWCVLRSGIEGTRSAAAKSWMRWGKQTAPRKGAIAVLSRGPNPAKGHVAFLERIEGNQAYLLGGNQSDAVVVKPYPVSRVLTYRWPA